MMPTLWMNWKVLFFFVSGTKSFNLVMIFLVINDENNGEIQKLIELIHHHFMNQDFDGALGLIQEMKYRERVKIRVNDRMEALEKI